jgi:uncharacterized protein (DUF4415 family)
MKLRVKERQRQLDAIARLPDEAIDTSDIPELTEEDFRRAVRGRFYRPIKKPVTMRLDADVIHWLKKDGPGYQTKANTLLREAMLRAVNSKPPSQERRNTQAGKRSKRLKAS